MQKTQVRSQGQEDPLEQVLATHSRILAWRISWTEEPGALWSIASHTVGRDLATERAHSDLCRGRVEGEIVEHGHLRCIFQKPPIGMIFPPVNLGVEI